MRQVSKIALLVVAAVIIFAGGFFYWWHAERYRATDDAYVNANVVQVQAQVSGTVTHVSVVDQQHVARGAELFTIDPRPYQFVVTQAQARLAMAKQTIDIGMAGVTEAQAELRNRQALLENARTNVGRVLPLVQQGFLSHQAGDNAQVDLESAEAQVSVARAKLERALKTRGVIGPKNEHVQEIDAALGQARLDLEHARVTASCSGRIASLSLQPGNAVHSGTPLFALVCDDEYWVDANFKETELEGIQLGQSADVTVDTYGSHHFSGRVENIGGAAGAAFSLLPPENATGNWVKVTQRVPIRIHILDPDEKYPLRVGTSAKVAVDTHSAAVTTAEISAGVGNSRK